MLLLASEYLSNLSVMCCNLCSGLVIEKNMYNLEAKLVIRCERSSWENTPSFHMRCWNPSDPYLTSISL